MSAEERQRVNMLNAQIIEQGRFDEPEQNNGIGHAVTVDHPHSSSAGGGDWRTGMSAEERQRVNMLNAQIIEQGRFDEPEQNNGIGHAVTVRQRGDVGMDHAGHRHFRTVEEAWAYADSLSRQNAGSIDAVREQAANSGGEYAAEVSGKLLQRYKPAPDPVHSGWWIVVPFDRSSNKGLYDAVDDTLYHR
jgi:hypothetical protein